MYYLFIVIYEGIQIDTMQEQLNAGKQNIIENGLQNFFEKKAGD